MDQAPNAPLIRNYPGGVRAVDTGLVRPEMAASFLVTEGGRAAFIEAGTAHSTAGLLAALPEAGLSAADVDWVIVTHVHLDHAGGAGRLMRALPNATLIVHPRGAPHMADPTKLVKGATAVYGDRDFAEKFGEVDPVEEHRIRVTGDGDRVELAGRAFGFLDTPGHARHHFCVWDERTRGWFTGDTFGLSYREFDTARGAFLFPTTTPIDFDPGAMHDSVERLLSHDPEYVYLTHYGRLEDPAALAPELHRRIDAIAAIGERHAGAGSEREAMIRADMERWLLEELDRHGVELSPARQRELLAMDLELNAQGLDVWLTRREKARS